MTSTYMGYVVGLRGYSIGKGWGRFGVAPEKDYRISGGFNRVWHSPRLKAKCRDQECQWGVKNHPKVPGDFSVPHVDIDGECRCGINMYKADERDGLWTIENIADSRGIGLTLGWGKVVVHRDGYRVEQALVVAMLLRNKNLPDWLQSSGVKAGWTEKVQTLPQWVKRGVRFTESREDFIRLMGEYVQDARMVPIPDIEGRR